MRLLYLRDCGIGVAVVLVLHGAVGKTVVLVRYCYGDGIGVAVVLVLYCAVGKTVVLVRYCYGEGIGVAVVLVLLWYWCDYGIRVTNILALMWSD